MRTNSFEVKSRSKLYSECNLVHKVSIKNLPLEKLTKTSFGRYFYIIYDKDAKHEVKVELFFGNEIVSERKNLKDRTVLVEFLNDVLNIKIESKIPMKEVYEYSDGYRAYHSKIKANFTFGVEILYSKDFYKEIKKSTPLIENVTSNSPVKQEIKNEVTIRLPKGVRINNDANHYVKTSDLAKRELLQRDFYQSELTSLKYTPNSDSIRPRQEVLGGTGSNMYRRKY